jgi:lipopolysaccharide transport system permease protein
MVNIINGLIKPFSVLIKNKNLIYSLAKKDIISRYRGSFLGILWSFFNPLLMLGLYTFFFRYIFKAKWPNIGDTTADYAVMLFSGLVVHALASDILSRSSGIIANNSNLVKKVVFPIEIMPWVVLVSSTFHTLISLLILYIFYLINGGSFIWTNLFILAIFFPMMVLFTGFSYIISSIGVYIRDIEQLMGTITTLLLFTSTTFFSIETIPQRIKPLLYLNPITQIINDLRNVLVYGKMPSIESIFIYSVISFLILSLGYTFFNRVKKSFADIL